MSDAGKAIFNQGASFSHDVTIDADGRALRIGASQDLSLFHSSDDSTIRSSTGDLILLNTASDKDIIFKGNDGGSTITALTLDMSEAGNATFNGSVTANTGVIVDQSTFEGNKIATSQAGGHSGDFTIDSAADIILDANGADILLKDNGTTFGLLTNDNFTFKIQNHSQDTDIKIIGNDGGSLIDALTFDMSEAGAATFNSTISSGDITSSGTITGAQDFKATGSNMKLHAGGNHILNIALNGLVYPQTHNAVDLGHSNSLAFRNLFLSGAATIGSALFGKTSSAFGTAGTEIQADGAVTLTRSGGAVLFVNRLTSVGEICTFSKDTTQVGSISVTASSTAFNTSSDYRLKENVVELSNATERLKQLAPKQFNFIVDADTTVDGFLAHEVQPVVPEAVTGTKDGMKTEEYQVSPATGDIYTPAVTAEDVAEVIHSTNVEKPSELEDGQFWRETTPQVMGEREVPDYQGIDQSKLVPLLVATIQELEARITALEGE
jgi:hypothetical protein